MYVKLQIPTKAQIINGGFAIQAAPAGVAWSKSQLGAYADSKGVYIHHCGGQILYIGKTTSGEYGTFGERLRREFQELASGKSRLHQLLCSQTGAIRTYCLDLQELDMMVDQGPMTLSPERKALIMEQVLIGIYEPPGNRVQIVTDVNSSPNRPEYRPLRTLQHRILPPAPLLHAPYLFYLKRVIPVPGRLFLGNPDNYRLPGRYTEAFGNGRTAATLFEAAGLEVTFRRLFFGCATALFGRRPGGPQRA